MKTTFTGALEVLLGLREHSTWTKKEAMPAYLKLRDASSMWFDNDTPADEKGNFFVHLQSNQSVGSVEVAQKVLSHSLN